MNLSGQNLCYLQKHVSCVQSQKGFLGTKKYCWLWTEVVSEKKCIWVYHSNTSGDGTTNWILFVSHESCVFGVFYKCRKWLTNPMMHEAATSSCDKIFNKDSCCSELFAEFIKEKVWLCFAKITSPLLSFPGGVDDGPTEKHIQKTMILTRNLTGFQSMCVILLYVSCHKLRSQKRWGDMSLSTTLERPQLRSQLTCLFCPEFLLFSLDFCHSSKTHMSMNFGCFLEPQASTVETGNWTSWAGENQTSCHSLHARKFRWGPGDRKCFRIVWCPLSFLEAKQFWKF